MRKLLLAFALTAALASSAEAQKVQDARVADLVQSGTVRLALFLPQYTKNSVTGEVLGNGPGVVAVEIGRALAARLGVKLLLAGYPTPAAVVDCLKVGACDIALIAITPSRTAELGFTPPVVQQDYTLLVPAGSSIRSVADADRPGVRIAAVRNHLSTMALSFIEASRTGVRRDPTFDLLRTERAGAFASTRPTLLDYSTQLLGSRVLEDRYGANLESDGGSEGQGRTARLCQRVRRGGQGFGLGAASHRERRTARRLPGGANDEAQLDESRPGH